MTNEKRNVARVTVAATTAVGGRPWAGCFCLHGLAAELFVGATVGIGFIASFFSFLGKKSPVIIRPDNSWLDCV